MAKITIDFEVGDVVTLNSGGPDMTIDAINGDGVSCSWFDNCGDVQSGVFTNKMLTLED